MSGNLCEHCVGYCCRHIALPIDRPTKRSDFDDIRWYLLHGGVTVFVEDGDWYLHIETTCRHLQPDFRCGIYETRPQICRDYSTENCDYHSGDYGWEAHFASPDQLDAYVEEYYGSSKSSKSKKSSDSRNRKKSTKKSTTKKGKKAVPRGQVAVRLRRRPNDDTRFSHVDRDRAGIPLPVLRDLP